MVAHSEIKLVVHEAHIHLGLTGLKEYRGRQETAVLAGMVHKLACRHKVWRRLVANAVETENSVLLLEGPDARFEADKVCKYVNGDVDVMSPAEYLQSVNRPKIVFCPVAPSMIKAYADLINVLLDANELHTILSYDQAQERFLTRLRQRAAKCRSQVSTLIYREGR